MVPLQGNSVLEEKECVPLAHHFEASRLGALMMEMHGEEIDLPVPGFQS